MVKKLHQYKQKAQQPLTSNHKKTMTYGIVNPCPGLGQAQNVAGLN